MPLPITDAPKTSPRERLAPASWVIYDFSDTIFSASILTFYFPLWVTEDMNGSDALFAVALSASMLLVVMTAPAFGAISDRLNMRVPLLAICVAGCAGCVAMIGSFGGLAAGLALFIGANFIYQTGLVFYNSLIIRVSSERNRGLISGIGIGAGYMGLIASFIIFAPLVDNRGNQAAFIPTALLYTLFALPLLLIIKENGLRQRLDFSLVAQSYKQLYQTFRRARLHANLFRFLIARFAYMEAINTVSSFFVIYLIKAGGFEESEARDMIIRVVIIAMASSVATGWIVSKLGAKPVLLTAICGWAVLIIAASIATAIWMFWGIAIVMGFFWAAPQIADRVLLAKIAPEGRIGEFFGLFQMSGRLSAVLGPALWGLTIWGLEGLGDLRYRIAVMIIALFAIAAVMILLRVKEQRDSVALRAP